MTDFSVNMRNIQRISAGSVEYKNLMDQMGNNVASKIGDQTGDDELLFNTMQYYKTMEYSDEWSADAQDLSVEDLIKLWKEQDEADKTFAKDFIEFDEFMQSYKKTEPENFVRPYVPDDDLTDDQKNRMKDFDLMRAHDVSLSGDTANYPDLAGLSAENGDYALLFEYLRQREGTSFLYPSDYNKDGTVNEKGQAKEAEMIAKLQELCTADQSQKIGTALNNFLEAYNVSEPVATDYGTVDSKKLTDLVGEKATKNIKKGEPQKITIGENEYFVTNIGDNNSTPFAYEVKSEDGHVYIQMKGDNLRIQDISGKLQGDVIELQGAGNEVDLGMGDDILSIIGDNNRALMGDGDDKVYVQGENNFSDLWRGDDQLFNIRSDKTIGIGFTGDDEFYTKGDNVVVNGESPHKGQLAAGELGDGLYQDGVTESHDIERTLNKPSWFPDVDPEEPTPPGGEVTDSPSEIEFNGVKYYVYQKQDGIYGASDKLKYYKDDQNRTVFESNGWNIKVVGALNKNNDKDYANVVVKGNSNTYMGSLDNDTVEIQGNANFISGDNYDQSVGNDKITITSGTGNYIYGDAGADELTTSIEGNFFNDFIFDIEKVNGETQTQPPATPATPTDSDKTDAGEDAGGTGAGDGVGETGKDNDNGTGNADGATNPGGSSGGTIGDVVGNKDNLSGAGNVGNTENPTDTGNDGNTGNTNPPKTWANTTLSADDPAYRLTDNGTYHEYTMNLLGVSSPEDLKPGNANLTKYNLVTEADYKDANKFNAIRVASDLCELLDRMDSSATNTISAGNLVEMHNLCSVGAYKDQSWSELMKLVCDGSGLIDVDETTGVATVKSGFSNVSKVDTSQFFFDAWFNVYYTLLFS